MCGHLRSYYLDVTQLENERTFLENSSALLREEVRKEKEHSARLAMRLQNLETEMIDTAKNTKLGTTAKFDDMKASIVQRKLDRVTEELRIEQSVNADAEKVIAEQNVKLQHLEKQVEQYLKAASAEETQRQQLVEARKRFAKMGLVKEFNLPQYTRACEHAELILSKGTLIKEKSELLHSLEIWKDMHTSFAHVSHQRLICFATLTFGLAMIALVFM